MDYADKLDMMDDDRDIEGFEIDAGDVVIFEELKNRLRSAGLYEIVRNNFVYFPKMKHLGHGRVDFSISISLTIFIIALCTNNAFSLVFGYIGMYAGAILIANNE